jgi:hypothetical protein
MGYFVHAICDYAPGDLAWAEVISALYAHLPEGSHCFPTSAHSFSTIETGFILGQLALAPQNLRKQKTIVFANAAPRKDRRDARDDNEGEGLVYALLNNGMPVLVVNSGFSLSFVKDEIRELWTTKADRAGSQFRSRDYFPQIVGMLANGDLSFREEALAKDTIAQAPQNVIAYVDSFGNIKTTIRMQDALVTDLKPGSRLRIIIGSHTKTATLATGSFNVQEGDLAFAPGSSGQTNRFMELFARGGNAWKSFGKPTSGSEIKVAAI